MKVTIYANELNAMRVLASVDETRWVLCGVYIELQRLPILVATDGRRIGVCRSEFLNEEDGFEAKGHIVVPNTILNRLFLESTINDDDGEVLKRYDPVRQGESLIIEQNDRIVTVTDDSGLKLSAESSEDPSIHAMYPEWRQILPERPSEFKGPLSAFNLSYLSQFGLVAERLGCSRYAQMDCWIDAEQRMCLSLESGRFFGIMMSCKRKLPEGKLPDFSWLKLPDAVPVTEPATV